MDLSKRISAASGFLSTLSSKGVTALVHFHHWVIGGSKYKYDRYRLFSNAAPLAAEKSRAFRRGKAYAEVIKDVERAAKFNWMATLPVVDLRGE